MQKASSVKKNRPYISTIRSLRFAESWVIDDAGNEPRFSISELDSKLTSQPESEF